MGENRIRRILGSPPVEAAAVCAVAAAAVLALGVSNSWAVLGDHTAAIMLWVTTGLMSAVFAAIWLLGGTRTRERRVGSDTEFHICAAAVFIVFFGAVFGLILIPTFLRAAADVPGRVGVGWPAVVGTGFFLVCAAVSAAVLARLLRTAVALRRHIGAGIAG